MLKYHCNSGSAKNTVVKNARIINGPKGIGSFLVLIFVANRKIDIIAPYKKDKKIVNKIYLTPSTKPKAPILKHLVIPHMQSN
jgi:hypothetical protein